MNTNVSVNVDASAHDHLLALAKRYSFHQQYTCLLLQKHHFPKAEKNVAKASRREYFAINFRMVISNGLGLGVSP